MRCRRATAWPSRPWNERQRIIVNESVCLALAGRGFLDTEFFHSAIEGLPAHAELARRVGHDVAVFGEHALDGGPIEHRFIGARAATPLEG